MMARAYKRFFMGLAPVLLFHLMMFGGIIQYSSMTQAQNITNTHFPSDFIWGVAISSHQAEGGNEANDWFRWEQECRVARCEKSGQAADFWNRYDEDFTLAREIGAGLFRTSLEWSRLESSQGTFSVEAFAHYRRMLTAARAKGLKVMLTLHHFTLPLWVVDRGLGGWADPEISRLFEAYSRHVVEELGDLVDYWITVNEPNVNMLLGYVAGVSPPGLQNFSLAPVVLAQFLKAHALAYHAIHERFPNAKVSISHHVRVFDAENSWNPLDVATAHVFDDFWNHQPLRAIKTGSIDLSIPFVASHHEEFPLLKGTLDYLGINYYSRDKIRFNLMSAQKFEIIAPTDRANMTDVDWEIYPEGLERLLLDLKQYDWPIMITENGLADAADTKRSHFICEHLKAMRRAMDQGVNVTGYVHWSLFDNFEWSLGFAPRFGLYEVNYTTLERSARPSAAIFKILAETGDLNLCQP